MSLQAPLTVHLSGMGVEEHVDAVDLEFTTDARGGYQSATFSVVQPIAPTDLAFGAVSRVMIDDGRTGRRVWEGFLDVTGKTVTEEAGQAWKIGAVGSASVLTDRAVPYIACDTDLSGFELLKATSPGATAAASTLPNDETTPALVMQFPSGQPVDSSSYVSMQYGRLRTSGQMLGGYGYTRIGGRADSSNATQSVIKTPAGVKTTLRNGSLTTGSVTDSPDQVGTDWTVAQDRLSVVLAHTGAATNIAVDTVWTALSAVWVRAQLHDLTGTAITTAGVHNHAYVYAHEVVIDALTVFTNQVDVAGANIDTTFAQQIPQAAYPDPVRLPDLLNDLALLEPDMIWEVLESNAAGKHRFNLRRWPTDVRYETDSIDGWDNPGAELDLSTDISIGWTDATGAQQTYPVRIAVPALDQWGRRRDIQSIDLGAEVGSLANATAVATALAAQMASLPYAGTLTVARPIRDLYLGRDVMPWEIRPGYLVNVRDIDAPAMQLTEVTYHDNDQTATLTLGTPVFSIDQVIARLARRRQRAKGKPKALPTS